MTEANKTQTPKFFLSVFIDLTHPAFAGGGTQAKMNAIKVLSGAAEAIAVGSEATLIKDDKGVTIGVFAVTRDDEGTDKRAFTELAAGIEQLQALDRARREQLEQPEQAATEG